MGKTLAFMTWKDFQSIIHGGERSKKLIYHKILNHSELKNIWILYMGIFKSHNEKQEKTNRLKNVKYRQIVAVLN